MEIIKIPKWSIIKCSCGAEFKIDKDDVVINTLEHYSEEYSGFTIIRKPYIECPFCGEQHNLKMGE